MRILIADDNALVRGVIAELIQEHGWEVCGEAANGVEAVRQARALQPDVMLLDLSMPGVHGFQIANELRREWPVLKLVVVSQHDFAQLMPDASGALADAFVDKVRLGTDLVPAIEKLFAPL